MLNQLTALQYLLDCSSTRMFMVDRNYCYQAFNHSHARTMLAVYGARIETGRSLLDAITVPADREKTKQNLDRALSGEEFQDSSYSGDKAFGRVVLEARYHPVEDENNTITGVCVVSEDGTRLLTPNEAQKSSPELLHQPARASGEFVLTTGPAGMNEQMHKLTLTVEENPRSIVITNRAGEIEYANPAFTRTTGYELAEVVGKNPRVLKSSRAPDETYQQIEQTILSGQTWSGELLNRRKNGEEFWESTVITPVYGSSGQITHFVGINEDITARKQAEQALLESEKLYRDLFDLESDTLFIIRNQDGQILEANEAAVTMYGFSHAELLQLKNTDLSSEPKETWQATRNPKPEKEIVSIPRRWHHRKNGEVFPVEITARFIKWKGIDVHLAAVRDITSRWQIEQDLERLAVTDPLTGLFNRRYFFTRSVQIFERARLHPYELAALMIDIDHFKSFNDRYGHAIGDQALVEVARRLAEGLRTTDVLARHGGEEFAVLLPRADRGLAVEIAGRLLEVISGQPFVLQDLVTSITVSIGVAVLDKKVADMDMLMAHADRAMYQAKQNGRNCQAFWGEG